jgi:acetyl-CoA carboxylase carboxyl transferase subunit alpha
LRYDARVDVNQAIASMKQTFLDFEQPIAELQQKIDELRFVHEDSAVDISDEISRLAKKSQQLTKDIYGKLTSWQIAHVARHPQRPYTKDYIDGMFSGFRELHGDRTYADDPAIIGGLARFNGQPCMVIGHQKGRDTKEKIHRNFGMPRPEGYRKALRLMRSSACRSSRSSTRRAPTRASAPRSAASRRPSAAISMKWPACASRSSRR